MDVVFHTNYNFIWEWEIPMHQHECYELSYFFGGRVRKFLPNRELVFHEKQFVLIPPNTPHTSEVIEGPVEHIFILTSQLPSNIPSCEVIDDLPDDEIGALFKQIYLEYNRKPTRSIDLFFALQNLINAYYVEFHRDENTSLVSSMRRILHNNVTNPDFSISESFSSLGFSANHLREVFKNETGLTPKEYLLEQRLQHSCQLLVLSKKYNLQIKDVAIRSGFKDPLYFSRYFREKLGSTPTEYLNQYCTGVVSNTDDARMSHFDDQANAMYLYPRYSERFSMSPEEFILK